MLAKKLQQAIAGQATATDPSPWDLAYAYFNPLDWDSSLLATTARVFSVNTEEAVPQGIFFKPDGSKMYVVGSSGDDVNEYSLSTPWNLNSPVYAQSFSVASQNTLPTDIFFKPDGTKMYILGGIGDNVYEYSLSTAWDISTASYLSTFSVASQDTSPDGITFKIDGTRMYVVGSANDNVYEYSLSTPWNISTASYVQAKDISSETGSGSSLAFKPDGKYMFVMGYGGSIYKYTLSTPWDISTASGALFFTITAETQNTGIFFRTDGKMYSIGSNTDSAREYTATSINFSVATEDTSPQAVFFKPDGTKMYIAGNTGDDINEYSLSTAWDTSTASYVTRRSVATEDTTPQGVFFKPDGTRMYVVGGSNDTVYEYSLSSWAINTASYVRSFSVTSQDTGPTGIFFSPDGTNMYVVGSANDSVYQYSLSTAWDISSASYVQSFSVTSQETGPSDLFFKEDGTKMYVIGGGADSVHQYSLSTAWDISSASYEKSFYVGYEEASPQGLFFHPDGNKFFTVGSTGDAVYEYLITNNNC